jgi:hypothetical protein
VVVAVVDTEKSVVESTHQADETNVSSVPHAEDMGLRKEEWREKKKKNWQLQTVGSHHHLVDFQLHLFLEV